MPKSTGEIGWDEVFDPDDVPASVVPTPSPVAIRSQRPGIRYETVAITLTDNLEASELFGQDLTRVQACVKASKAEVYIGRKSVLPAVVPAGSPYPVNGYLLPSSGAGEIFHTTDALYVAYRPATGPTGSTAVVFLEVEMTYPSHVEPGPLTDN